MGGLFLLLLLSVVMATASFLAGMLPLSLSLSVSQLRLISSLGVGVLVGTSLIVIIPEGIEAIVSASTPSHAHKARSLAPPLSLTERATVLGEGVPVIDGTLGRRTPYPVASSKGPTYPHIKVIRDDDGADEPSPDSDDIPPPDDPPISPPSKSIHGDNDSHAHEADFPTFHIGISMTLGFILMFLIDRLPRHATDQFNPQTTTRHISLDNLSAADDDFHTLTNNSDDDGYDSPYRRNDSETHSSHARANGTGESASFLGSLLAPSPRQSRSLATTTGLVIHSAADGIAMGASAMTDDQQLGLIVFAAVMIHKAPAAFGLTSVLLKQGLSKRAARGHLLVFSLAAPAGALATWLVISMLGGGRMEGEDGSWWTGVILLFSAGTFLYVAMHAMNETSQSSHQHHGDTSNGISGNGYAADSGQGRRTGGGRPQIRDTLVTVGGMLLPLLTQFGHHHHH